MSDSSKSVSMPGVVILTLALLAAGVVIAVDAYFIHGARFTGIAIVALTLVASGGLLALHERQRRRFDAVRLAAVRDRRNLAGQVSLLTSQANDLILLADDQEAIVEANDQAVATTGFPREELLRMRVGQLDGEQPPVPLDARLGPASSSARYETQMLRKDGTSFPVEVSLASDQSDSRRVFQIIARDLTERREAMAHILRVNRLYAMLSEMNKAIVRATDRSALFTAICRLAVDTGQFAYAWVGLVDEVDHQVRPVAHWGPDAGFQLTMRVTTDAHASNGGPTGSAARDGVLVICNDLQSDPFFAPWREAARSCGFGAAAALPFRIRDHVAGTLNVYAVEAGFFDRAEAKLLREIQTDVELALTMIDHEARRARAEAELREKEAWYRLMFEGNPYPMWVFDTGTLAFLAVNDAAIQRYGYTRAEFLSMTIKDLRPDEDLPLLMDMLARDRQLNRIYHSPVRHKTKDGKYLEVEIIGRDLTLAGRGARLITAIDRTERGQLRQQLQQAQKMEAIGLLAGGVAHDFNNILTTVSGYAELTLEELPSGHRLRANLQEIRLAADKATALTRQLLSFSRKQVLQPRPLNLSLVVREMSGIVSRLIGEDIRLTIDAQPSQRVVLADPDQLSHVLLNLVVNARDAMPQGGAITICVTDAELDETAAARAEVPAGEYVAMSVADTGIGMSADVLSHAFEPFFTTKERGKGTGLGLSTSYGIVKQSGGGITIASQPGRGTTVTIYLPHDAHARPAASRQDATCRERGGGETILLVEDEPSVRGLTARLLRQIGYAVIETDSEEHALAVAREADRAIDLVLTDVVMPTMSGPVLARHLTSLRPALKVLMMSGYAGSYLNEDGVFDTTYPLLRKPFTLQALAAQVRAVLDGSGSAVGERLD